MGSIEFTQNYEDHSTDMGFQFKFFCDRCRDGFMSTFKSNTLGVAEGLLKGASNLFGGVFGRMEQSAYQVERMVNGPQHDAAVHQAVEEIKPKFNKCRRCGKWVCSNSCWNGTQGMCKDCAPVAEEEESAIRSKHVQQQVANDLLLEENKRMSAKATEVNAKCECGADTLGKKFCPGCGKKLAAATGFCGQCGSKLTPGSKFCGECGHKNE